MLNLFFFLSGKDVIQAENQLKEQTTMKGKQLGNILHKQTHKEPRDEPPFLVEMSPNFTLSPLVSLLGNTRNVGDNFHHSVCLPRVMSNQVIKFKSNKKHSTKIIEATGKQWRERKKERKKLRHF